MPPHEASGEKILRLQALLRNKKWAWVELKCAVCSTSRTPNVEWRTVDCGHWGALGETNRQRPVENGRRATPVR